MTRRHWRSREVALAFSLPDGQSKAYQREFFNYRHPLFVQALLSFLLLTAERWLLQWFDGSVQQGFFALSQKVSMACFLFVSAMTPLIMRELSIAWGHNDREAMGRLLTRFAPLLYVVAAYFSCFTLVEGSALVDFFGGAEFAAATLPVQIMALYPLHQAYGQLAGSVFHATGRTRVLRNMAALECVYGFTTAWFLLAPPEYMGLNLGAVGLAIKTVVVQIITVNVYLWLASRFLPDVKPRRVRLLPGAIGDEQSALSDSFQDNLLAPPVYTRPAEYKGWRVPDILLSGHQAKMDEWRLQQAMERTERLRPDLLEKKD